MSSLEATEKECAEGRTAPRVSLDDIKASIKSVHYISGQDDICPGLTICVVTHKNGFHVVGKSAPASPENFDAELGRKLAYEDCIRQLWPLMGFELRSRLSA